MRPGRAHLAVGQREPRVLAPVESPRPADGATRLDSPVRGLAPLDPDHVLPLSHRLVGSFLLIVVLMAGAAWCGGDVEDPGGPDRVPAEVRHAP